MRHQTPNPNTEYNLLCEVLPQPVVQAAELCALPHSVDDALGYGIIRNFASVDGRARAVWAEVKQLPFVYPYEDKSWQFAESARTYFMARLERRNGTYLALHRYLKECLEADRQRVQDANTPKARELDWRITYHLTPLDAQAAIERLLEIGEQAARTNRLADMRGIVDLFDEQAKWLAPYQVERVYFEGRYAYARRDYRTAESCFQFVWEHGRQDLMKAIAGHLLGVIWARRSKRKWRRQAEGVMRESLELLRQLGDLFGEAHVLNSLGTLLVKLGGRKRLEEARALYLRSLEIERQLNQPSHKMQLLHSLGGVLVKLGGRDRLKKAEGIFRRSLELGEHLKDEQHVAQVFNSLGSVLVELGGQERWREAEQYFRGSLELNYRLGNPSGEAKALTSLGNVLVKLGRSEDLVEAGEVLQRSLEILHRIGDKTGEAMVFVVLSTLDEARGDIPSACANMEKSIAINEELGNQRAVQKCRRRLERLRRKTKG